MNYLKQLLYSKRISALLKSIYAWLTAAIQDGNICLEFIKNIFIKFKWIYGYHIYLNDWEMPKKFFLKNTCTITLNLFYW